MKFWCRNVINSVIQFVFCGWIVPLKPKFDTSAIFGSKLWSEQLVAGGKWRNFLDEVIPASPEQRTGRRRQEIESHWVRRRKFRSSEGSLLELTRRDLEWSGRAMNDPHSSSMSPPTPSNTLPRHLNLITNTSREVFECDTEFGKLKDAKKVEWKKLNSGLKRWERRVMWWVWQMVGFDPWTKDMNTRTTRHFKMKGAAFSAFSLKKVLN